MITATQIAIARAGRITVPDAATTNLRREGEVVCAVSYNGDLKPLKVGDRIEIDMNAPGDFIRVGDA